MKYVQMLPASIVLYLLAFSCNQPKSQSVEQSNKDRQHEFVKYAMLFADDEKLRLEIKKLGLTDQEIVDFCQHFPDVPMRAKMIYAAYSGRDFNAEPARKEFWAALRFNVFRFVEIVSSVREDKKVFMDIGSGNGEKLFAAICMEFEKAYGLEYSEKSYTQSKEYLKNFTSEIEITQGDALTIDSTYYQKADFLYMYSPIKDNKIMASLFKRVMESMKEGSILLEVRLVYYKELRRQTGLNFPEIPSWIAVLKKEGKYFYKNIIDHSFQYNRTSDKQWLPLEAL